MSFEYADYRSLQPKFCVTKLYLDLWEVWGILSLSLLPASLRTGVVVTVMVLFMSKIDLFKNHSYSIWPAAKKENILRNNLHKN